MTNTEPGNVLQVRGGGRLPLGGGSTGEKARLTPCGEG